MRRSLEFMLDLEGFDVESFADGEDLLRRSTLSPCACIIVDLRLPGRDGLALILELRSRRFAGPAILITSYPQRDTWRRAAAMAVSLVEKPLLDDRLVQEVRRLVAGPGRNGGGCAAQGGLPNCPA